MNTAGTNTSDSTVETIRPPITPIAIGDAELAADRRSQGAGHHPRHHGDRWS